MKTDRFKGIGGWVRWSVSEKKIVYLLVAALVVTGIVSLFRMNKDEFPTFQIKQGVETLADFRSEGFVTVMVRHVCYILQAVVTCVELPLGIIIVLEEESR